MDLHHQAVPQSFNTDFQASSLHPLQQNQPIQHALGPLTPHFISNAQANNGYVLQQRYIQQPLTSSSQHRNTASFTHRPIQQLVPASHSLPSQSHSVPYPVHQQYQYAQPPPPHPPPPPPSQNVLSNQIRIVSQHHTLQSQASVEKEVDDDPALREYAIKQDAHLEGLKLVPDPPDLERWRENLFGVEDMIVLTEEQFQIYFPHVDNVYSHRSTQKYKRKPFISHYWDCRLKGRPAGTPKSDDPNKKKRKRVARERDLCDVKIKITEYLPGATREDIATHLSQQPRNEGVSAEDLLANVQRTVMGTSTWDPASSAFTTGFTQTNVRFYTIQRVNGTGPNGKEEGAGGHKHSLDESDRIKKNSVSRWMLKSGKAVEDSRPKKKLPALPEKKSYRTKTTGAALVTAKKHAKENSLKLYGSCFCPFVQRVWIALEIKQIAYQYIEVDPYKKPESLLKINPRGLIPALKHGEWGCYESTVLMEYLEDLGQGQGLLPSDPQSKAICRLWTDHINRKIVPAFYHYLQQQDAEKKAELAGEFKEEIAKLVDAADSTGPFFLGPEMGFVDVQMAPWVVRLNRVLKPYCGWPDPEPGTRWAQWVEAIENNEFVKVTTSTDDLYLDSYERYAENRPNTSQVANAVNSGRGLP